MQTNAQLASRQSMETLHQYSAKVLSVAGTVCELSLDEMTVQASIATHVLGIAPGQRVVVLGDRSGTGWLVTAAWPDPADQRAPLLAFEPATGTLRIRAARLDLVALAEVQLSCGEARIGLSLDGKAHIEGAEVLSAATGSNRIEGATIDLN
ncbi:hypothetical protein CR152_06600 [Massilia violaceinigra]|uniref:Phage baseplate assembly protein V n=1 Tax=Massilia violaceinigra TaxID=2045208 RepID=A0A2D2DGY4_9BURK|nr:hypothetical protein [Massilia violaceinigra]ATQ74205.1 hypothetical protein CR152_06600 [Massilia violaceinigra]